MRKTALYRQVVERERDYWVSRSPEVVSACDSILWHFDEIDAHQTLRGRLLTATKACRRYVMRLLTPFSLEP